MTIMKETKRSRRPIVRSLSTSKNMSGSKEQQYQIFKDFIRVVKKYNITAFTMWGLNDELSWLAEEEPLLVDKDFILKEFAQDYIEHFSKKKNIAIL